MKSQILRELPGLAITAGRYLHAERIARRVDTDKPIALDMAAFVIADILDGAILRKFDADTPTRRIADGVVDHVSMARVAYSVATKYPESIPYVGILGARAATAGALNALHLGLTGEATKGQANQRLTNLATATFALVAVRGHKSHTDLAGGLASGVALLTLPAHLKGLGNNHAEGIRKL